MLPRDYQGPLNPAAKEALDFLITPENPNFYQDLIRSYIQVSDDFSNTLQNSNTPESYKKIAHTWRSSSLSLGAEDLAALCKDLEGNPENTYLIPRIIAEYIKVRAALLTSCGLSSV